MAEINLSEGDDDFTQPASQRDEWNNYYGLGGNDTIRLVQGVGVGGPGNDVIAKVVVPTEPWRSAQAGYWNSPTGVRVDLEQGWAEDGFGGRDTLIGIETVHSGGHADWFSGSSGFSSSSVDSCESCDSRQIHARCCWSSSNGSCCWCGNWCGSSCRIHCCGGGRCHGEH